MPTMMILRWKTKKVQFLGKNKIFRYDVTKWCHNVKILLDLESTHQGLSYEVLSDMVSLISSWPWGKQFSTRSEKHEGQGWSTLKTNQLIGRPYATFTPSMELIWYQLLKNKNFVDLCCDHKMTFDLGMVTSMTWLLLMNNYTRDVNI
jgi:hypothetical protein